MIALIAGLLLAPISAQEYEPLTPAEARAYWRSLTPEQLDQEIINLDTLENTAPEPRGFHVRAYAIDGDVLVQIVAEDGSPGILVDHAYLTWRFVMPDAKVEGIIPEPGVNPRTAAVIAGGTLVLGFIGGFLLAMR
jgi:hypothetical protein